MDNTILYHAVTHETEWVTWGESEWGEHKIATGSIARVPVHSRECETREFRSVEYLPGIAYLARRGYIELYSSAELIAEIFSQPASRFRGCGYFDLSVFHDIPIPSIDGYAFPTMGPMEWGLPSAREQQRARLTAELERNGLFAELVRRLGPKNSQDAWHIQTAEKRGMYCFLTMDYRLIENARAQGVETMITAKILSPEDFGIAMGLVPVHPVVLSYSGEKAFVQSEMSMPGDRRRPVSGGRSRNARK